MTRTLTAEQKRKMQAGRRRAARERERSRRASLNRLMGGKRKVNPDKVERPMWGGHGSIDALIEATVRDTAWMNEPRDEERTAPDART